MPRRPASPHRSARLRALAPAAVLSLLALTACAEQQETDPRPVSSADRFFDALESLEAVETIDRPEDAAQPDDEDQPDTAADAPTADPTDTDRSIVHLGDDADSVALRVAERDIRNLYGNYQYPDGPPSITIVSGGFTVDAPQYDHDSRVIATAPSGPTALNLTQLPHLAALPDVESGVLEDTQATARLRPGTDLRDWVLENADAPGSVRLGVTVDASAAPTTTQFSFTLGSYTASEAVRTLFETADAGGATVLAGTVGDRSQQRTEQGDLHVPALDDVPALHDALVASYGAGGPEGFAVRTDDDVAVSLDGGAARLDDVLDAHAQLEDAGAHVRTIEMDTGGIGVSVDDADSLRRAASVVSQADWPLDPEERVEISHRDHRYYGAEFDAVEWGARGEIIASLWDEGFTAVRTGRGGRGSAFGLTIEDSAGPDVAQPAGRDALVRALRTTDWSGAATISVVRGEDSVTFTSTATGRAQNPYNGRRGTDVDPPHWGQEVVSAWDATAG
jgi:hypothetical protein